MGWSSKPWFQAAEATNIDRCCCNRLARTIYNSPFRVYRHMRGYPDLDLFSAIYPRVPQMNRSTVRTCCLNKVREYVATAEYKTEN